MQLYEKHSNLPPTGFMRLSQIIGNPKTNQLPLIPESKSSWWAGVRNGTRPPPIKIGANTTVWRVEDIRKFITDGKWVKSNEIGGE